MEDGQPRFAYGSEKATADCNQICDLAKEGGTYLWLNEKVLNHIWTSSHKKPLETAAHRKCLDDISDDLFYYLKSFGLDVVKSDNQHLVLVVTYSTQPTGWVRKCIRKQKAEQLHKLVLWAVAQQ